MFGNAVLWILHSPIFLIEHVGRRDGDAAIEDYMRLTSAYGAVDVHPPRNLNFGFEPLVQDRGISLLVRPY